MLINCSENCIHQKNGICTMGTVGKLSNTTNRGCEFYIEKKQKKP